MKHTLEFKWTVSRGRDTYGYNICTLYVDGSKATSCNGGNYDMIGTCLADWMKETFLDQLKKLNTAQFYGLKFYKQYKNGKYKSLKRYSPGCSVVLDGGCGLGSMEKILNRLKHTIQYISGSNTRSTYLLLPR